jgi:hypothetical protein
VTTRRLPRARLLALAVLAAVVAYRNWEPPAEDEPAAATPTGAPPDERPMVAGSADAPAVRPA